MRNFIYILSLSIFSCTGQVYSQSVKNKNTEIVISGELQNEKQINTVVELSPYSIHDVENTVAHKPIRGDIKNGIFTFRFALTTPTFFSTSTLPTLEKYSTVLNYFAEPSDSVHIEYNARERVFKGKGAEKYNLITKINTSQFASRVLGSVLPVMKYRSERDFLQWCDSLDKKSKAVNKLIDQYQNKISKSAFEIIKATVLVDIEKRRLEAFTNLLYLAYHSQKDGVIKPMLTVDSLNSYYDHKIVNANSKWLEYAATFVADPYYLYRKTQFDAFREKGKWFAENNESLFGKDKADNYIYRYYLTKRKYKGIQRDEALGFFFYYQRGAIYALAPNVKLDKMLAEYYKEAPISKFKSAVKEYELKRKSVLARQGLTDFKLTGTDGNIITKSDFEGKVVVFDFWFTGCKACMQLAPELAKVEHYFKDNPNVVFASVSIDKDKAKWLNSIREGKFTSKSSLQLYTQGLGAEHDMIKYYGVDGYPKLLFFDAYGNLTKSQDTPDPRRDGGKAMIDMIKSKLTECKDGPYVFKKNDTLMAYSVNGRSVKESIGADMVVQGSQYNNSFKVALQGNVAVQPAIALRPSKLLALSDIEGNLYQFTKLLQNNGVIDHEYNWTFGNGNLVFCGDMFDRGNQVTECLWLLYSLEEKARKSGGDVHFILGNHEIMNLQGDTRYNTEKYLRNAKLLGKTMAELYGENSELGRWLRSKNVVEQIGDLLFAHGGISSKINITGLGIEEINKLARPNYALKKADYGDANTNLVMDTNYGPFWYRGYYGEKRTAEALVDSVLAQYKARHVITGHTIIADTISTLYHNKVINTDVPHAKGKSEALLILGNSFYRVNDKGQRWLLFSDEDKVPVEGK